MTLTQRQREILIGGLADQRKEVVDLLALKPSTVLTVGALAAVGTTDGSGGAGDAALAADVDIALTALQAKLDELVTALNA